MQITTFKRLAGLESYNVVFPMDTDAYASASLKILNGSLLFPATQLTLNDTPLDLHTLIQKNFCLAEKECTLMNECARIVDELVDISNISKAFILDYSSTLNDMTNTLFDYVESYNRGYKFFDRFISDTNLDTYTGTVDTYTTNFRFGSKQDIAALDSNFKISYSNPLSSSLSTINDSNVEIYGKSSLPYLDIKVNISTAKSNYGLAVRSEVSVTSELGSKITSNNRCRGSNFYPISKSSVLTIRIYGVKSGNAYDYSSYVSIIPFECGDKTQLTTSYFDLTSDKNTAKIQCDLDPRYTSGVLNTYIGNSDPMVKILDCTMGEFDLLEKSEKENINVFVDGDTSNYKMMSMGNNRYYYTLNDNVISNVSNNDSIDSIYYGVNCCVDTGKTNTSTTEYTTYGLFPFLLSNIFVYDEETQEFTYDLFIDLTISDLNPVEIYDSVTNKRVYQLTLPVIVAERDVSVMLNRRNLAWYSLKSGETYLDVPANFCYVVHDYTRKVTNIIVHEDQLVDTLKFRTTFTKILDAGFVINRMNISSQSTVNLISVFDSDPSKSALEITTNVDGTTKIQLVDNNVNDLFEFIEELGGWDARVYLNIDISLSHTLEQSVYEFSVISDVNQQLNMPKNELYHNALGYRVLYGGETLTSLQMVSDKLEVFSIYGDRKYCEYIINELNSLNGDMFVYSGIDLTHTLELIDSSTFNKSGLTLTLPSELISDVMPGGKLIYAFKYDGTPEMTPIMLNVTKQIDDSTTKYKLIVSSEYTGYPLNSIEIMMG